MQASGPLRLCEVQSTCDRAEQTRASRLTQQARRGSPANTLDALDGSLNIKYEQQFFRININTTLPSQLKNQHHPLVTPTS